jgi:isopentenyl-diphosphate delta-isomerase
VVDKPLTTGGAVAGATALRKMAHIDACLDEPVEFQQRTTGLEELELRYAALPEQELDGVDLRTTFLGKPLAAPVLIGRERERGRLGG